MQTFSKAFIIHINFYAKMFKIKIQFRSLQMSAGGLKGPIGVIATRPQVYIADGRALTIPSGGIY